MKRFLRSRATILVLIGLLLLSFLVSVVVPQRFSIQETALQKWRIGHPLLTNATDLTGLDHVFTTAWFSIILAVFLLALCLSAIDQFNISRKKTFKSPQRPAQPAEAISITLGQIDKAVRKGGYLKVSAIDNARRFMKHPWGHWGNFLFHAGLVVVIGCSLVLVCMESRGKLRMEEGQRVSPGEPWSGQEHGIFAAPLRLPCDVGLDNLELQFYKTDELRQAGAHLRFFSRENVEDIKIGVNEPIWYRGIKVYQTLDTGHNFYLEVTGPDGEARMQGLQFLLPTRRDMASYNEFRLDWLPYNLKGKYFADAAQETLSGGNPLLVLRMYDNETLLGELPLTVGASGMLGSYRVKLSRVARWAGVLFVDITCMAGVFTGFFIIVVGSVLNYFTPPREITAWSDNGSLLVEWKAGRFGRLFRTEYEAIMEELRRTKPR
jgi:cytochrome c biogenesis protein